MAHRQKLSALALIGMMAIAVPAFGTEPSGTPADITTPPGRSQGESGSKSDAHRIVGKVLHIDREQGLVRLATEEGVLVVRPPLQTLRAIKVGDTVSVPRSAGAPNASPRE